jgi:hypothetical protein
MVDGAELIRYVTSVSSTEVRRSSRTDEPPTIGDLHGALPLV